MGLNEIKYLRYGDDVIEAGSADQVQVLDGLARYVGETWRKTVGGRWQRRYDDPSDAFYGLPELAHFPVSAPPVCPHRLVTASIDRGTGRFLQTMLQHARKRQQNT